MARHAKKPKNLYFKNIHCKKYIFFRNTLGRVKQSRRVVAQGSELGLTAIERPRCREN
jgi:hypothetical protein